MKKLYVILFVVLTLGTIFTVTAKQKVLKLIQKEEVTQTIPIAEIDYIEIADIIDTPTSVTAKTEGSAISLSWGAVDGATYSIYRSTDNVNYTCIAKDVDDTKYVDRSPATGTNYYKIKASTDGMESEYSAVAVATMSSDDLESGIYLGITGFNKALYTQPITLLSADSESVFDTFVDNLEMKHGTVLYYAVDKTLDALQTCQFPADLSNVAIVTFTDGLDQGSFAAKLDENADVLYETDDEYLDALNTRIRTETVGGNEITAYSIGLRGSDVHDVAKFQTNLRMLASDNDNAFEVSNMSEVNAKFQEIAEHLTQINNIQTINLTIPAVANGTRIRFTFDNPKDAANSKLYLEGSFNLRERSLYDIEYVGLKSTSGTSVKGIPDGIFVTFTFEGVNTESNTLITSEFTDEWTYITSTSSWQINSEFDKKQNSSIETLKSSATIVLILDCSSSIDAQFGTLKNNAKGFIKTLCDASDFGIADPGNPDNPEEPNKPDYGLYSTSPIDLSVAVWMNDQRYYLTVEQYKNANLSNAIVEGATVVSGGESFIIEPGLATTSPILLLNDYQNYVPSLAQGRIMSARWNAINNVLNTIGGYTFITGNEYWLQERYYFYQSGGTISGQLYSSAHCFLKRVQPTSVTGQINWNGKNDLTACYQLADGSYSYVSMYDYEINNVPQEATLLGLYISYPGSDTGFVLGLHNEDCGTVVYSMAETLYGDKIPTIAEAQMISARWSEINQAISNFGGNKLLYGDCYWVRDLYYTYTSGGDVYGQLSSTNYCYVRPIVMRNSNSNSNSNSD